MRELLFSLPFTGFARAGRQPPLGNARDLHPIYPPHLRPTPSNSYRALKSRAFSPRYDCLSMRLLFVGTGLAYRFLQTPPRDGTLAVRLTVPTIRVRRGLHLQVNDQPPQLIICRFRDTRHTRRTREPALTGGVEPSASEALVRRGLFILGRRGLFILGRHSGNIHL